MDLDSDYEEVGYNSYVSTLQKKGKKKTIHYTKLAVLDLDKTLQNEKFLLYESVQWFLTQLQQRQFYLILMTSGNKMHLDFFKKTYSKIHALFNVAIADVNVKSVALARSLCNDPSALQGISFILDDNLVHMQNQYDLNLLTTKYYYKEGLQVDYSKILKTIDVFEKNWMKNKSIL